MRHVYKGCPKKSPRKSSKKHSEKSLEKSSSKTHYLTRKKKILEDFSFRFKGCGIVLDFSIFRHQINTTPFDLGIKWSGKRVKTRKVFHHKKWIFIDTLENLIDHIEHLVDDMRRSEAEKWLVLFRLLASHEKRDIPMEPDSYLCFYHKAVMQYRRLRKGDNSDYDHDFYTGGILSLVEFYNAKKSELLKQK